MTFGQPLSGTYYLGDKVNPTGNWYFNFEIGQASWNSSQVGLGQNSDGVTNWNYADAVWYEDGTGSNKHVRRDIGNFQFTATGTWYVVGRAKANSGDAYTYADAGGWTNNTDFTTTNTSYWTISALGSPTSQSATSASSSQIDLSWTKWSGRNVMILRKKTTDSWTEPTQGTAYTVGTSIGSGTVVYNNNGTTYSNTGLAPGISYDYKFYSENYSYYSDGVTATASTATTSASDYFRSKTTGSWGSATSWESSPDNSVWITSALVPDNSATSVTILNGHTITLAAAAGTKSLTINTGGGFASGSYTLTVATGGTLANNGTFDKGTGTVNFSNTGTISGTIAFNNVIIAGGVDFGSNSTIYGNLTINVGGYVNTHAPYYGSGSSLVYNSGTTYGRGTEWSANSGQGYPFHVQISSNTTLDLGANTGMHKNRRCFGNLTVDNGSTFSLNINAMDSALTVLGNITNNGTITLSQSLGGDLKIQGDIIDNGTFNANNRAVFFNGPNTQTISGTGTFDISYVRINKTGGSVKLGSNLLCEGPAGGNAMEIDGSSSMLDLNGYILTLGKAGVNSTFNSGIGTPGVIKGSSASGIIVLGTGTFGALKFDQSTPGTSDRLQNLTIDRTTTGTVSLGSSLTVGGTLTLTNGTLVTDANTLTIAGTSPARTNGTLDASNAAATLAFTNSSSITLPASFFTGNINNLTINGAGVNLGNSATIAGTLSMMTGTLTSSGTLSYGTNGVLLFNGIGYSATNDLLFPATGGPKSLTITTAAPAGLSLHASRTLAGSLTVASGQKFIIPYSKSLTVSNGFSNSGTVTLTSPTNSGPSGSLIVDGTISGNIAAERNINGYTSNTDGWHTISSPVNNMVIAGSNLQPGTPDDLYKYNEVTNMWLNFMVGSQFTNFSNGEGYLCAYQTTSVKKFIGVPNNSDITFTNLSLTANRGWHLLGNPYPSAVKWNDGNWAFSNINGIAKIFNSGGSYSDINPNGIIPSMQGFFVQVTNGTNSIKIPKASRIHDLTNFYKETETISETLKLTAQSDVDNTFVEAVVRFDPAATPSFDNDFDAHFLPGISQAPQMYTVLNGNDYLSTNVFPPSSLVAVPMNFIKGTSGNYTLTATGTETFSAGVTILLEDLKTGNTQNLMTNPVYPFTSLASDNPNRFKLHFSGALGVTNQDGDKEPIRVYTAGQDIYINNSGNGNLSAHITVYNLLGQIVTEREFSGEKLSKITLNGAEGYYLVKVVTGNQTMTAKVFVR